MRRTKAEAEQTKADILNAAAYYFSEHGFAKTALKDIAKMAEVTRGAIYWHFKNKAEIFDALHEQLHQNFLAMMEDNHAQSTLSPLSYLQDKCIALLLGLENDLQKRQSLKLFLIKCDYVGDLHPFKEKHLSAKQECDQIFQQYFDEAIVQKKLSQDVDSSFLTTALMAFMKGILLEYLKSPEDFNLQQNAPKLMNFFFKNLIETNISTVSE